MTNIIEFVRKVELDVAQCENCESMDYLLATNGEIYCSCCRQFAPNIRWNEVDDINE